MLVYYRALTEEAHSIIGEAFTTRVITVGTTTCDDVRWWMREEIIRRGFAAGFHPRLVQAPYQAPHHQHFMRRFLLRRLRTSMPGTTTTLPD